MDGLRLMALGQGVALIGLGAWPLVSMRTFELVTGPKHDDWLVRTVGGLSVAIGVGLVAGSRHAHAVRPLGVASAATFLAADVIGVGSGRLRPVYLLDAVAETAILGGWAVATIAGGVRRSRRRAAGWSVGPIQPGARTAHSREQDPTAMHAYVAALLKDAQDVAHQAWPGRQPPPPVEDALRRLARASAQLEIASGDASGGGMPPRELLRLNEVAAGADIDAASVKEAAYLVSS
ncbi:hypothetical protein BH23CHL8_BH23CHL8_10480 [soil metagenome]